MNSMKNMRIYIKIYKWLQVSVPQMENNKFCWHDGRRIRYLSADNHYLACLVFYMCPPSKVRDKRFVGCQNGTVIYSKVLLWSLDSAGADTGFWKGGGGLVNC